MNKGTGYAFGFLLVLAVVALGFYVAFTSFQSTRAALLAEPTRVPRSATPTQRPTTAPTSTYTPIPTPIPGITLTLTATALPSPTPTAKGAKPAKATKAKPSATPAPTATVPSASSYAFRLAGAPAPETEGGCCYIRGTVRDAAGSGLPDIQLQATDEWGNMRTATTKTGTEAGQYDFPITGDKFTYYVKVVDTQGTAISTQAIISFDPDVAPAYRVDWKRNY
jgi:hypothetical protein